MVVGLHHDELVSCGTHGPQRIEAANINGVTIPTIGKTSHWHQSGPVPGRNPGRLTPSPGGAVGHQAHHSEGTGDHGQPRGQPTGHRHVHPNEPQIQLGRPGYLHGHAPRNQRAAQGPIGAFTILSHRSGPARRCQLRTILHQLGIDSLWCRWRCRRLIEGKPVHHNHRTAPGFDGPRRFIRLAPRHHVGGFTGGKGNIAGGERRPHQHSDRTAGPGD